MSDYEDEREDIDVDNDNSVLLHSLPASYFHFLFSLWTDELTTTR